MVKRLKKVFIVVSLMFLGIMGYSVYREYKLHDISQYYAVYSDPNVIFLRKALNAYLANDKTVPITKTAIDADNTGEEITGLDSFSKDYYQSKFVVLSIEDSVVGGKEITLLFQDKPDRIFRAWTYLGNSGSYDLRGFFSKDPVDQKQLQDLKDSLGSYLSDKSHAI